MAAPTFNAVDLTAHAEKEIIGSPVDRSFRETMPGVNGAFSQDNGIGPRTITVTGMQSATSSSSAADAAATLKTLIRAIQDYVGSVAEYVGADSASYPTTSLASYVHGPIVASITGTTYTAYAPITATIIDLDP